jgi:hypothetical protein
MQDWHKTASYTPEICDHPGSMCWRRDRSRCRWRSWCSLWVEQRRTLRDAQATRRTWENAESASVNSRVAFELTRTPFDLSRLSPFAMDYCDDDWGSLLADHPIFALEGNASSDPARLARFELSEETLSYYTQPEDYTSVPAFSGRRSTMVIKDTELVVAIGPEVRVTSLKEAQLSKSMRKAYKVRLYLMYDVCRSTYFK